MSIHQSYIRGQFYFLLLYGLAALSAGCSEEPSAGEGVTCGAGTTEEDGSCIAEANKNKDGEGNCGTGTSLVDGDCVADTLLSSLERACGEGTSFDSDSETCVAEVGTASCGAGTQESDGKCTVDPSTACSGGTSWDEEASGCIPEVSCGEGTVAYQGECLTPSLVDWLSNEAQEEPERDWVSNYSPSYPLEIAASGQATLFKGTIEAPRTQPHFADRDRWSFEAKRGDLVRVAVSPVSDGVVGFRVVDQGGAFVRTGPTGSPGMEREIFIPADGTYFVEVAPQDTLLQESSLVGGGGYDYLGSIQWEATPAEGEAIAVGDDFEGDLASGPGYHPFSVSPNSLTAVYLYGENSALQTVAMTRKGQGDWVTSKPGGGLVYSKTGGDFSIRGDYEQNQGSGTEYSIYTRDEAFSDEGNLSLGVDKVIGVSLDADEYEYHIVGISAGQRVYVSSSAEVIARLDLGNGRALDAPESLDANGYSFNTQETTHLILNVGNPTSSPLDFDLTIRAVAFTDLGDLQEEGDELAYSWGGLSQGEVAYYNLSAAPELDVFAELQAPANQEVSVWFSNEYETLDISLDATVTDLLPAWNAGKLLELYVLASSDTDEHEVRVLALEPPVLSAGSQTREAADTSGALLSTAHRTVGFAMNDGSKPDLHRIEVTETAYYRFVAQITELQFDATLTLMAEDGSVILLDDSWDPALNMLLDPGTYYVQVSGDEDDPTDSEWYEYALSTSSTPVDTSLELDDGSNQSAEMAQAIDGNGWDAMGAVHHAADEDWYSFTAASGGSFELALAPLFDSSMEDTSFTLYEADGSTELSPSLGFYSLTSGTTYLVQVTGDSGFGAYRLSLSEAPLEGSSSPSLAFDDSTTVDDIISLDATGCTVSKVVVYVDIEHSFRGDIELDLKAPGGQILRFFEDQGGSADDLVGAIPGALEPTTSLDFFRGVSADGNWTLSAGDDAPGDNGVLNEWSLKVYCQ